MADPTTIPDLRLWLKADSLATTTTDVSSWSNSAPGFTTESVSQATAAKMPVYSASALNALPAVMFDGVDDMLVSSGALLDLFRNLGGATVFVVARSDAAATTGTAVVTEQIISFSSGGSAGAARLTQAATESSAAPNEDSLRVGGRRLDADSFDSSFSANDSWPRATWKVATGAWDWANAALRGYLNGTLSVEDLAFQTAGLTENTASLHGHVGAHTGGTSASGAEFLTGPIAEMLVYRRLLTAAERADVHSYLQDRYAITVSDYVASVALSTYRPTATTAAGGWTTAETSLHGALSDQLTTTHITGTGV